MGKTRLTGLTLALTNTFTIMLLGNFMYAQVPDMKGGITTSSSNILNPAEPGVTLIGDAHFVMHTYYKDADRDGFGDANSMLKATTKPVGYVENNLDCNDYDDRVQSPNYFFVDSDKDGFGSESMVMLCTSLAPVGFSANNSDCNDADAAIHPEAPEKCFGIATKLNQASVTVYPNPGPGVFQIDMQKASGTVNLRVYNLQGQLILEKNAPSADEVQAIDLTEAPAGIYTVSIKAGTFHQEVKLSKN